eukprot:s934_g36.t1
MVFNALVPIRLVENARKVFPNLPGRTSLSEQVDEQIECIREEVAAVISEAAEQDSTKFSLQADGWKSRLIKRDNYVCVILSWVDRSWKPRSACIAVEEFRPPRTGKRYHELFKESLEKVGLLPQHLVSAVSDHESAVRLGMKLLCPETAIGCGCHFTQLLFKHSFPTKRQCSGTDSSSESESSSSSSSSSEEEVPVGQAKASRKDPEHVSMQNAMKPLLKRFRRLLQYFVVNPDQYRQLEEEAKQRKLAWVCFQRETATRWSSTLALLETVCLNRSAINVCKELPGQKRLVCFHISLFEVFFAFRIASHDIAFQYITSKYFSRQKTPNRVED